MSTSLDFNSYQTPLNEVTLKVLDSVSQTELFDSLSKIKLLEILTSKTRLRAKDLPRWDYPNLPDEKDTNPGLLFRKLDPKGRIFVDISNPHILEDMQYFRPAAKHFEEFGCYTKFFENPDPNSDFMKFWNEERRRCLEGYVREYDGEWIPGYLYHYWNYGRVKVKIKTGKRTANEVVNFPHVYDSTYWFFHYIEWAESTGYFGFLLKKRRWGYSYILETMLLRNYTHIRESKGYIMASQKEYLYRDGPMPKFKSNLAFVEGNTPFISPRLIDTMEHTKAGYKDKETGIERGRFSEVMGVTCKDDPDKGRGKSGKLVAFEEVGVFPQVEKTWTVTEESVKQGDLMYGFLLAGGTGGTDSADFSGAEKMFYNPEGFNIKPLPNVYSKTNGNGICAFFVPTYLSYEEYYDKDGNSDVTGALIRLLAERQKIRQTTNDSNRLLQKKAEAPITPEEAVLRKEGSIFPILDIKEFLSSIYPQEDKFVAPHYTGNLILDGDGEVRFALNKSVTPIRHYPTKPDIDKVGCLEIFEHPQKGGDRFRYIIGVDPVENDEVLYSVSLASVFVFDRYTRRIVAEYSGRPSTTNEFFEICYRLALYYNCTIMYENNKKGMYAYFQTNKKALHLLADFPEHLKDRQTLKPATFGGNTSKGYTSNPEIKKSGKKYQADWMLEIAYSSGYGEPEFDEDGNPIIKKNELNLHKIRSIGYLEEASQWTVDGNFDRVDAMTAIMIYDIELGQFETTRAKEAVKTKLDDPFFKRTGGVNYKNKSILQKGWNY